MLKTSVTSEVANGPVLAKRLPAPRYPQMRWRMTERGIEARWAVRPEEPAHFVLRNGRLVPAALG